MTTTPGIRLFRPQIRSYSSPRASGWRSFSTSKNWSGVCAAAPAPTKWWGMPLRGKRPLFVRPVTGMASQSCPSNRHSKCERQRKSSQLIHSLYTTRGLRSLLRLRVNHQKNLSPFHRVFRTQSDFVTGTPTALPAVSPAACLERWRGIQNSKAYEPQNILKEELRKCTIESVGPP
jgi:hypothetical protein